jgi:hypothetical protein
MPVVGWIDALRQYNAGMPSWCVPRKGTPGYDMVMRIRQGEKPKSFKELTAELERKTGGKPKGEKTSMKIDLGETKDVVNVPTTAAELPKTDAKESTKKLSQQKTMAVTPVNYVAEGGSWKDVRWWKDDKGHVFYMDGKIRPGKVYDFNLAVSASTRAVGASQHVGFSIRDTPTGSPPSRIAREGLVPMDESKPQDKAFIELGKDRLARPSRPAGTRYEDTYTAEDKKRIAEILKMKA